MPSSARTSSKLIRDIQLTYQTAFSELKGAVDLRADKFAAALEHHQAGDVKMFHEYALEFTKAFEKVTRDSNAAFEKVTRENSAQTIHWQQLGLGGAISACAFMFGKLMHWL